MTRAATRCGSPRRQPGQRHRARAGARALAPILNGAATVLVLDLHRAGVHEQRGHPGDPDRPQAPWPARGGTVVLASPQPQVWPRPLTSSAPCPRPGPLQERRRVARRAPRRLAAKRARRLSALCAPTPAAGLVVAALFAVCHRDLRLRSPPAAPSCHARRRLRRMAGAGSAISAALSLRPDHGGVAGFAGGRAGRPSRAAAPARRHRHDPGLGRAIMLVATVRPASGSSTLFVGVLAGVGMSGFYLHGARVHGRRLVRRAPRPRARRRPGGIQSPVHHQARWRPWLIDAVGWRLGP